MVRTFVAIALAPPVLDALAAIQSALQCTDGGRAGRWVRAEGIHLTLKFLGDVAEEALPAIYDAVQAACAAFGPFDIAIAGLGCFPNARRPRVVWVGVREETGQLAALQQEVERSLGRLGYPPEGRAFRPHLTLARVRQGASRAEVEALGKAISTQELGEVARMRVEGVHVIKSDLRPSGAVYTMLHRAPLGRSGAS